MLLLPALDRIKKESRSTRYCFKDSGKRIRMLYVFNLCVMMVPRQGISYLSLLVSVIGSIWSLSNYSSKNETYGYQQCYRFASISELRCPVRHRGSFFSGERVFVLWCLNPVCFLNGPLCFRIGHMGSQSGKELILEIVDDGTDTVISCLEHGV